MPSTKADPDFEARLCRSQAVDFKLSSFWRTNGGGGGFDVGEMSSFHLGFFPMSFFSPSKGFFVLGFFP